MRRSLPLLLTLAALLLFAAFACKNEKSTETTSSDTAASNSATAAPTTNTATTASSTTGTATTTASSTPLSNDDHKLADKFAEGDASEVAVGKLALTKATNPDVKSFAQKLVTDHTNATNELVQIARAKNLTLTTELDKEHRDFEAKLDKLSGAAFDKQFIADMVKDHDKDQKDFEKAQKDVKDADLKSWIDKTLPVIKEHDKIAHDLQKKVGGGGPKGGVAF